MVLKLAKNLDEIANKIQTKKNLGWNRQIVNENQIIDMWCVLMWYFYPILCGWMLKFEAPLQNFILPL